MEWDAIRQEADLEPADSEMPFSIYNALCIALDENCQLRLPQLLERKPDFLARLLDLLNFYSVYTGAYICPSCYIYKNHVGLPFF